MKYIAYGWETRQTHNKTMKQYTKPKKSYLFIYLFSDCNIGQK